MTSWRLLKIIKSLEEEKKHFLESDEAYSNGYVDGINEALFIIAEEFDL